MNLPLRTSDQGKGLRKAESDQMPFGKWGFLEHTTIMSGLLSKSKRSFELKCTVIRIKVNGPGNNKWTAFKY